MNPATPARSLPVRPAARRAGRADDRTTDAIMAVIVGGVALFAALPLLDMLGYV